MEGKRAEFTADLRGCNGNVCLLVEARKENRLEFKQPDVPSDSAVLGRRHEDRSPVADFPNTILKQRLPGLLMDPDWDSQSASVQRSAGS